MVQNHPELQQYQWKIEQLGFEQRLKAEKLKPKVNLSYNFLSERTGVPLAENFSAFNSNDYKWGLTVSMPLLLREGRVDWCPRSRRRARPPARSVRPGPAAAAGGRAAAPGGAAHRWQGRR